MHLTTDEICQECRMQTETSLHVLRDCKVATDLWLRLPHSRHWREFFFFVDLKQWFIMNISKEMGVFEGIRWSLIFGITIYTLWSEWNLKIFQNEGFKGDLAMKMLGTAPEIPREEKDKGCFKARNPTQLVDCMITWKPPNPGCVKLNVDGAVSVNGQNSSCGGILRSEYGEFLDGFTVNLGSCFVVEVHTTAWRNGYKKVIMESDSAEAVCMVQKLVGARRRRISYSREAPCSCTVDRNDTILYNDR